MMRWVQLCSSETPLMVSRLLPMPDMDNGRLRHQGDSLDEDPENAFAFHQLLLKYDVDAYVCGHTHNTSYAKINGLWQIDAGHARGLEERSYADLMYAAIDRAIDAIADPTAAVSELGLELAHLGSENGFCVEGGQQLPRVDTVAFVHDQSLHDVRRR